MRPGDAGRGAANIYEEVIVLDWIQIVSTLGFPIVMCGAMAWYVKYITDRNYEHLAEERKSHEEETNSVKEALINNTSALITLAERLGGIES